MPQKIRYLGLGRGACGTGFRGSRRTKNARAIDNYGQSRFVVVNPKCRSFCVNLLKHESLDNAPTARCVQGHLGQGTSTKATRLSTDFSIICFGTTGNLSCHFSGVSVQSQ